MKAKHLCLKCGYKWESSPGPHNSCPECGHLYIEWLNYEEMKNKWDQEGIYEKL